MTGSKSDIGNWENLNNYKPCRKKQYSAYICMPPKGTIVIDKFTQHQAYRLLHGEDFHTISSQQRQSLKMQKLKELVAQNMVSMVTDSNPFVVCGASGEFYVCSAQSVQNKFYLLQNNQPVRFNEMLLKQRMKDGVLDWCAVRFIPNPVENLVACFVPTKFKGQIQTWMGIMTINEPSISHGGGDFVVAKADAMGVPNRTMRFVENGVAFADKYDARGWENCIGTGSRARVSINTLPRIV